MFLVPKSTKKNQQKGLLSYVFKAFEATTIIVLLACAIISLPLESNSIRLSWWEYYCCCRLGCSISVACNFKQSRQFEKFSLKSGDIKVDVLRDGQHQHISMHLFVLSLLVIIMVLAIAKGLPLAGR